MCSFPSLSRFVTRLARWRVVLPVVVLLGGGVAVAQSSCVTTITGKVYSPLGPTNGGDPIPNILVYVAQGTVQPFVADSGPQSCTYQQSLVSGAGIQPIENTTGADGTFTMSTNQITTSGPQNIVIQAGKWRRQYPGTQVTACTTNNIGNLTMPANQSQGDLPHIALVTGGVDGAECIFHQIGISDTEVTTQAGGGSINLYEGAFSSGSSNSDTTATNPTLSETALVTNLPLMETYDVIMFACQGSGTQTKAVTAANQQNLLAYTGIGGRVFATHWEYIWLDNIFPTVAAWDPVSGGGTLGTALATVDQTWANGVILTQWLHDINADNGTAGQITVSNAEENTTGVYNPPAQSWATFNSNPKVSIQFTFDTPLSSTGIPAVTIAYTNQTQTFKPGDVGDSVVITAMNISTTPTTPGLQMAVTLPAGLTATSATDPTGTWTCVLTPSITCTDPVAIAPSSSDSVTLVFNIASSESVGQATISTALSGGGISGTGQCGRVLYNDYHVEGQNAGSPSKPYPSECSQASPTKQQIAQEKFLEYSLYDLSNFIATNTTDVIVIAGTPVISWPTPAAIPYGTALSTTQLDATATFAGTAVAGTFAYTPAAGTVLPLGTSTLGVTFTPTDVVDYTTATGSTTVQVVADTTTVAVTSGTNPSYLGQTVVLSAAVGSNGAVAAGQTVNFFDGLTQIGSGVTNAAGVATDTTSGLIVGTHQMTACVVASAEFNASCSPVLIQLVTLIPTPPLNTSSVLTSNANPSFVGQNVTFTVGVATTGAFTSVPTGTVTFYDGTTALGTGTLGANGFTTFSTSSLALGTHTITAVYGGNSTMAQSTSNVVLELVLTSLPSAGSGFLLTVNPINVSLAVGTSQTINVQVLALNNFQPTVTLSCTGNFPNNGCALAKTVMPSGGGSTTMTLTALAPAACGASSSYFTARGEGMGRGAPLLALGGLGLGMLLSRRRRRLQRLMQGLSLALALCVLPMLTGCGGKCTDLGTAPGSYTLTVTAVSANTQGPGSGSASITQTQKIVVTVHL